MAVERLDDRLTIKCKYCGAIFLLTAMIFSTNNGKAKAYCPKCKKKLG